MNQEPPFLKADERGRYLRQLLMADWSEEDQVKFKNLRVTVMGIGGDHHAKTLERSRMSDLW